MTKDEALIKIATVNAMDFEYRAWARQALANDALEKKAENARELGLNYEPEPVKIAHKHEWFRTGEMKVGQMRCISCGTWGQEERPQRTWIGLTDEEMQDLWDRYAHMEMMRAIEAKLKEKNT